MALLDLRRFLCCSLSKIGTIWVYSHSTHQKEYNVYLFLVDLAEIMVVEVVALMIVGITFFCCLLLWPWFFFAAFLPLPGEETDVQDDEESSDSVDEGVSNSTLMASVMDAISFLRSTLLAFAGKTVLLCCGVVGADTQVFFTALLLLALDADLLDFCCCFCSCCCLWCCDFLLLFKTLTWMFVFFDKVGCLLLAAAALLLRLLVCTITDGMPPFFCLRIVTFVLVEVRLDMAEQYVFLICPKKSCMV